MSGSEFGSGYAVCLIQFLYHEPRLHEYLRDHADMRRRGVNAELFTDEHAVELWASGAVDHLYDIKRPRRWVTATEWARAKALCDTMAAAKWSRYEGIGATAEDMGAALNEARALLDAFSGRSGYGAATFAEAWALDERAGLKPERGSAATCEAPTPSRTERVT